MRKLIIALLVISVSCKPKLDQFRISNGDIEIFKYSYSEITSGYDYIDVKQKGERINVFKANTFGFVDIKINNDTILIQYLPTIPYKFIDTAFGYKIIFDSSVSIEYHQQKAIERGD